jgi:hypothetical protein
MGRFLAMVLMYVGILVLALPISVIGAAFTKEYEKQHLADSNNTMASTTTPIPDASRKEYHRLRLVHSYSPEDNLSEQSGMEKDANESASASSTSNSCQCGVARQRDAGDIRRELAMVTAQLRGLAGTVESLMAELEQYERVPVADFASSTIRRSSEGELQGDGLLEIELSGS